MPKTRPERPDFIDRAHTTIVVERHLAATPAAVFDVLADAPGWQDWWPGMRRAEWTSPAPHGVDSTRRVEVGRLAVQERFIVWDPGVAWGFTWLHANLPLAKAGVELAELTATDGGTHLRWTLAIDPPALMRPVVRLARSPFVSGIEAGLDGLAAHLA